MGKENVELINGTVKWFDARRGYGFLVDEDGFDHFVHYSEIKGDGFRFLKSNDKVTFESSEDGKGRKVAKCVSLAVAENEEVETI